ncbi:MAG: transposase, partial [Candidatus Hydrogenedentes bacterium]|nr:transposase [Candidatus Hydrogenedentota bacterium]
MQTRRERGQEELFVAGPLYGLVPRDHILRRIDAVVDFSWLHDEVRQCYCENNGRPSIDPESALRLMLAGFLEGIVHDRALMRRAQTDLAFRWFAGYRLDEALPDHSSLTRIRQRWGAARFQRIFQRTVLDCAKAGLVRGDTVHIDATLIRADVSWESLSRTHAERVLEANAERKDDDDEPPARKVGRPRTKPRYAKKTSATDPDASMATSRRNFHLEPAFKQHTAVDDHAGVIVDVAVQTGEANEGRQLIEQLERIEANTGFEVHTVTADKGYA